MALSRPALFAIKSPGFDKISSPTIELNMPRATISVIIPYFQAHQTIVRAVRSVLMQTVRPVEILVIDDGSPDDPSELLKEFGPAVTLIKKSNGGAVSARNMGIEHACGEWVAFIDADDYWEPTKLERQLAFGEHAELIGSRWFVESPGTPRRIWQVPQSSLFGKVIRAKDAEAFEVAMNLWTSVVLVRRDALGEQRFVSGLEPAEDRDLWIRLASSMSVYLVPELLATYVQYENSLSNANPDQDCGSMLKVIHRHSALLGPDGTRKQEAIVYRRWAGCHLARGRPRSAIIPAARRLSIQPTSPQAWWIMGKALGRSVLS